MPRDAETLKTEKPGVHIEHERKAWHPVVWQQPAVIVEEKMGNDAPHKRIVRNIYRFFKETEANPEARKKQIEDMLLALPSGSKS